MWLVCAGGGEWEGEGDEVLGLVWGLGRWAWFGGFGDDEVDGGGCLCFLLFF